MEGPLVSDTTELLGGAPSASEDAPVGNSAPPAAAGGTTVSASKSRSRGGTGLSSLLLPELQRMAQSMGIQGAGRLRKGQLVEAIQARQAGTGIANQGDRKSTRLNSSHMSISYAVFCLKKKKQKASVD